ncbi:MAG: DUF3120 domain-containing protein [Microcystaceae cyanobacterium]
MAKDRPAIPIFLAACFLVSVPVFIQAPLVRFWPLLSLVLTIAWIGLGGWLMKHPRTYIWGDLLIGFSGSWLAGSIYWGWFRTEPLIHLPIESIGLPVAIWCLWRKKGLIGAWFYLGSLLGTAITDGYFYVTDLIPFWREVMQVSPDLAAPILQKAIAQVQTPWGISWAIVFANILLGFGLWAIQQEKCDRWAFAGAVLSTILVDSLFWIVAVLA